MYFPENIDVLILTFLGIENRHRCLAKTKRNIICKNNISPYNLGNSNKTLAPPDSLSSKINFPLCSSIIL